MCETCIQCPRSIVLEDALSKLISGWGIYNLNINAGDVKGVIEDKNIVAVTLTGSDPAGRSVASIAGANLKKTVMELGGSDAYIVLDDANLEEATDLATMGRLQNNGQTCIAVKRIIVLDAIYDKFLELFTTKMRQAKMGDPMEESTYYGPMARLDLRNEIHEQVTKTIAQGGSLILGGEIPEGTGAYYPATILINVQPGMEAFDNELFGPVAPVSGQRMKRKPLPSPIILNLDWDQGFHPIRNVEKEGFTT